MIEKVAGELAAAFSVDNISGAVREAWDESHALEDLIERARRARDQVEEALEEGITELSLPHLPTIPELREKAEEMFHESSSLDAIVNRAHEILSEAVTANLYSAAVATR